MTEDSRRKAAGAALAAGGMGSALAAANTGRLVGLAERNRIAAWDRRIAAAPRDKQGKLRSVLGRRRKIMMNGKVRNASRIGFAAAGFTAAAPAVWIGGRQIVEKRLDQHDWDAAMAGGLVGAAGYQGLGYTTNFIQGRQEKAQSVSAKAAVDRHRRANFGSDKRGRVVMPPKGDPAWKKYNRTYPLDTGATIKLPLKKKPVNYGKYRRVFSYLQGGKTQIGLTAGAGTLVGLAAMGANRKLHPVSERKYKDRSR